MDKAEENECSIVSPVLCLYMRLGGRLTSHPCSRASLSLTTRLSDSKEETHKKLKTAHTHTHVRTHCRGVVRTLVDIIRPDTFLSRFQIRRVCILLNADSVSLFLFPPTQPRSLYLFVLLTCLIPETPWLIRAVQTTLCPGAGGNKDQPKKKKKKEKREREREREKEREREREDVNTK